MVTHTHTHIHTYIHTHTTTTITLAAHAHRGLITGSKISIMDAALGRKGEREGGRGVKNRYVYIQG